MKNPILSDTEALKSGDNITLSVSNLLALILLTVNINRVNPPAVEGIAFSFGNLKLCAERLTIAESLSVRTVCPVCYVGIVSSGMGIHKNVREGYTVTKYG